MRNVVYLVLAGVAIFLATTGFECASSGVMSAKVYYTQKNYDKARSMLEAEVRKNPRDEEAWYYLALTAHEQGDHVRVAQACDSAEISGTEFHQKTETVRQSEWVDTWNAGIMAYNNSNNNKDSLNKAIQLFRAVWMLDHSDPEPLRLIGSAFLAMDDTASSLESYRLYVGMINANVQKGIDAGLMLGIKESEATATFGTPDQVKPLPTSDSVRMLEFRSKGVRLFFSVNKSGGGARTLIGWQWKSASIASPDEDRVVRISVEPFDIVGNIYFQQGNALMQQQGAGADSTIYYRGVADMDSAGEYLATAQRLNPTDEFATTMLSQIYLRTNQLQKAAQSYKEMIQKFPSNKSTRLNFGILLLKQSQYTDAEKQFKEALKIDPNYSQGLYYLAITYKNWSADIQASIRASGKKETDADRETYLSKLRSAAEYFEKLHAVSPDEYAPLGQLGEIYAILGEDTKMKAALKGLESMQSAQNDNPQYWNSLGTIYTVLNDVAKAKEAFDKMDALQKK